MGRDGETTAPAPHGQAAAAAGPGPSAPALTRPVLPLHRCVGAASQQREKPCWTNSKRAEITAGTSTPASAPYGPTHP